ncbi:diguanylate phosphodiesterase [Photobacterium aphoticum]|uniref:Diguanylate phosphodiesterase n=1 Tax=Photobacterium aphoticum TaxID=754436 RepID=A0A0J1GL38_9GAMM|nr:diguanylate phosphodiesterase [Photobacterium aphoticum]
MKKLIPVRTGYRIYLRDISAIAVLLLPLTLANAVAVLLGHGFRYADYSDIASMFFRLSDMLINIYPLALCVVTSYYLSHKTNINSAIFIIYSVALLYLVSIANGSLSAAYHLPNNPLVAIVSAFITLAYCTRINLPTLEPQAVNFAPTLFKHVLHFFVFASLALSLSTLSLQFVQDISAQIKAVQPDPLTFTGGLIYQSILGLLGAIGINGHNLLFSVKQMLYAVTQENLTAWQAGEASLNVISQGFYDAFMSMGGSGNSISLLLCILLFSKERNHIMLAMAALPMVMFNINEVLLFGLPIIFNPVLIVPFVLVPLVSFVIAYFSMFYGLVSPVTTIVDWMTPPLLSGYIAMNNSLEGTLLQLVIIVVGIFIYRPFYLAYAGQGLSSIKSVAQFSSVERMTFRNLLTSIRASAESSISKATAQQRMVSMLREGELVMHYQLLHNLHDPKKVEFEALLRYRDPSGKVYFPTFIQDFQLLDAMPILDKAVLEQVLLDMQKMPVDTVSRVAINMSVASISEVDFAMHLKSRLTHYNIAPTSLAIEITEEAILSDSVHLCKTMEELQAIGIMVVMDDFGAGYASFPHLLKYPFDKIKIDRSLLVDATTQKGKDLYHLVAQIGNIANCSVVAEGVENEEEMDFVARCGVDVIQGYHIARPQPLADAMALVETKYLKNETIAQSA